MEVLDEVPTAAASAVDVRRRLVRIHFDEIRASAAVFGLDQVAICKRCAALERVLRTNALNFGGPKL